MLEIPAKQSHAAKAIGLPLDNPKQSRWQRLFFTIALVSLGATAVAFGLTSISYRLTHLTINNGIINGRTVRLQSPIDGTIKAFYAQPGVAVKSGQVLARIAPTPQAEQSVLQLQGEINSGVTQLAANQQSLALFATAISKFNNSRQIDSGGQC